MVKSVMLKNVVHKIKDSVPDIHSSVFVAQTAEVAGEVFIGESSSVWFSASVRGDIAPITIGKDTSVQDGAVIHCDTGQPCRIGDGVTIGHGAIVHSAEIGNNTIIGMGAIILNQAVIGEDSIVGAGALVTGGKTFPPKSMILGSPAKAVRELTPEELAHNRENAQHYVQLASSARTDYQEVEVQ
ncbi:gamma carbonic anhydrase family protein [Brucepastera parasyntrophica]|uniref:gamma carbonic anhydrase family protein n=1 Tax=Brucepastera parasyntrophica TaxID=2880008 RepID=UPI00210DA2A8|nr:gamma carbonic anhydrase family protein [Brucepastera parasyntrophica]ULQ58495.1 gamma carbonic anhydrase family protein [Brucepastera parasyntrophica]